MREIRTSGSTRGEWVVLMSDIAHSPTLLPLRQENIRLNKLFHH